ncbi:MAG: tetrahydrofolate dehydrogenase/cyclohydrolase catalytic domain-containing protein, partial [Steroidobacteraceae bacterium]
MSARIIDGKAVAKQIRAELKERIDRMAARHGVRPGLTVILVGDNAASKVYVRGKLAACKEVGIKSEQIDLPAETTQTELLRRIDALNADPGVHGILVQLPLPQHIDIR